MRPSPSTDPRHGPSVVVPQTSFLGDVVLTTPLLDALREGLAPRRLVVVVRPDAVALVDGHPAVDAVIVDAKRGADAGIAGLLRLSSRLRRERFDLAVVPHRSLRTACAVALAGIPRRIGFDASRGARLFHETAHRDRTRHDVLRNLALLGPLGVSAPKSPRLHVAVAPAAAARAEELLPASGRPLVGIAPSSVWETKRWTEAGFAAVVRALGHDGASVVVLGAPGDEASASRITSASGAPTLDLTGRIDLATLVAVIDRLDVLIANDSAPMHIATARATPVVAIFCATTPALGYGPWSDAAVVVEAALECRPCARHGGRRCPRGTDDCRHLVEAPTVLRAVRDLLADPRRSTTSGLS